MNASNKNSNIALLGFGRVARAFAASAQGLRIVAVADSSGARRSGGPEELLKMLMHKAAGRSLRAYPSSESVQDVRAFVHSLRELGTHVLVESLPSNLKDGQPAQELLCDALAQGVSVVTVDKGSLVHGFERLTAAAASGRAKIAFRGTTGVWPATDVRNHTVMEITGILNGTTNYILSAMCESGLSFDAALREAKRRGIAEPDPRLDIDGWDAAAKILILSRALMNARTDLSLVTRNGISQATQTLVRNARSSGRVVRLMARAQMLSGQAQLTVGPEVLSPESPFYSISGTSKAAIFHTVENGQLFVTASSGLDAISEIILEDIRSVTDTSDSATFATSPKGRFEPESTT